MTSNACCLSRSLRIGDISETSKKYIQLKRAALLQQVVELCDSLHTSLVWGMQKVYTSSKCNWKNLKGGETCSWLYKPLVALGNMCSNHRQLEECPRGLPLFHVLIFFCEVWPLSEAGYTRTDGPLL